MLALSLVSGLGAPPSATGSGVIAPSGLSWAQQSENASAAAPLVVGEGSAVLAGGQQNSSVPQNSSLPQNSSVPEEAAGEAAEVARTRCGNAPANGTRHETRCLTEFSVDMNAVVDTEPAELRGASLSLPQQYRPAVSEPEIDASTLRWHRGENATWHAPGKRMVVPTEPESLRDLNDTSYHAPEAWRQANFSLFRPTCQVNLNGDCQRWSHDDLTMKEVNCTQLVPMTSSGRFAPERSATYMLDRGLAYGIALQLQGKTAIEFGAGEGCYTAFMHDLGRVADLAHGAQDGISVVNGFDGADDIEERTEGLVRRADLSSRGMRAGCMDYVIDLDTAVRVPPLEEKHFVDNLHRHNMNGIIIAWPATKSVHVSDEKGNEFDVTLQQQSTAAGARVNYRDANYVISRFTKLGYAYDEGKTKALRDAAGDFPWFGTSLFHFTKEPTPDCPQP